MTDVAQTYNGAERRAKPTCNNCERIAEIKIDMETLHVKVDDMESKVLFASKRFDTLEEALKINSKDTEAVLDILTAAKGFFRVAGWFTVALKWIVAVATGLGGLWLVVRGLKQ